MLYPFFYYYRRLFLPITVICFDSSFIIQFGALNLVGVATLAVVFLQRPFEQGNTWEIFEELFLIAISYHVLCFTQFV